MRKPCYALFVIVVATALGCGGPAAEHHHSDENIAQTTPSTGDNGVVKASHDIIYSCACGPECDCNTVSTEPGTCTCGAKLVQGRVLMVDGHTASVCTCGPDCTCEIDSEDPTKCSCGNEIKLVSLEGTGLYFCNCGGRCTCNHIAAKPGECHCGMQLITS